MGAVSEVPMVSEGRVVSEIRRRITSGRLAAGSRVTESALAAELGISRSPLREALRILEQEGLVSSTPNRGVTVTELGAQDIYEISTLRRSLEEMAVRMGVPVTVPARLHRLENAFDEMLAHAHAGSEETAAEDSYRFHLAVIGLAGHTRLERAYSSLALQLAMHLNRRARAASESLVQRAERHRPILDGVRAGDPTAVIDALGDEAAMTFVTRVGSNEQLSPEAAGWFAAARARV